MTKRNRKKDSSANINFSKNSRGRKRRKRLNMKKVLLLLLIVVTIGGCVKIALAYRHEQEIARVETENKEKLKKLLENNQDSQKVVGQKKQFKEKVGVDAQKVWNALNAYDYDNGGKKEVFLTFDDGPSTTNTPKVLEILKNNGVKGTFFVIGRSLRMDGAPEILKQIYEEGHAIGNHSYTHDYSYLYPSRVLNMNNFLEDFNKNSELINKSLGMDNFSTRVIRCPGGQLSWKETTPLNEYMIKNNMASIDWNALNGDAEGAKKNADQLYDFAVKSSAGNNLIVLLMHDTYGKEETVKYLDKIIKYYKSNGYEFKTLV